MVVVDVGVTAEAKVLVQAVDVGQCLVGTVGTARGVQAAEVHLSKAEGGQVHSTVEEWVVEIVGVLAVRSVLDQPA